MPAHWTPISINDTRAPECGGRAGKQLTLIIHGVRDRTSCHRFPCSPSLIHFCAFLKLSAQVTSQSVPSIGKQPRTKTGRVSPGLFMANQGRHSLYHTVAKQGQAKGQLELEGDSIPDRLEVNRSNTHDAQWASSSHRTLSWLLCVVFLMQTDMFLSKV